ncbi:MAG: hypothetical protein ACPGOY_09055 [Rhodospirillaceae bacterium]
MSIPKPEPGLVIRYSYLWRREARSGLENGRKDRPCAVIVALARKSGGQDVVVLPITHSPPNLQDEAVEIPIGTKRRLGLDEEPSWIVVTEANVFQWPGPDIRPAQKGTVSPAFGMLPKDLTQKILQAFRANMRRRKSAAIRRSE